MTLNNYKKVSIALLVISDRVSRGEREDGVRQALTAYLEKKGHSLGRVEIAPDETGPIKNKLVEWADSGKFDLVLTAGGTGVAPRDVTPEATKTVLDREIPGIPEAMRAESAKVTKRAVLARGLAGIRNGVMIVNLPGSPKAATENLQAVFDAILHGIAKAKGDPSDCNPSAQGAGSA